ncbi:MAG: DNA repair protein RecN, partial [Mariprofundaceae bacterium]|nr:DNA repair protein RecN [Mariprofundaceae bacterium]
ADWVRHEAERAEVIAEIETADPRLLALLNEQDIDAEDDGILIRRVINQDGRSRAWVNGIPTSAGVLKAIGAICLDLHGQHEHQTLLQVDFQRLLIDSRLDAGSKNEVQRTFTAFKAVKKQLKSLHANREDAQEQETWMRDESARVLALNVEVGLEGQLEAETAAARFAEQIQQVSASALTLLDEGENNVRSMVAQVSHQLAGVSEHHTALQEAQDLCAQMETLVGEITPYLQEALDNQLDLAQLQQAEDRLAELRACLRRHHTDEQGLLDLLHDWDEKLSALDTASWDEEALKEKLETCEQAYQQAAAALHEARVGSAAQLLAAMRPFLNQLGLKNMQLQVSIVAQEESKSWFNNGWDVIEFLAAANPGEPFKSLAETASGGELSRLVLALKGCGALEDSPMTAVFDEVDVGIGGETGWCVGELLQKMGQTRQVLVVSHLPQVAACANHQVVIEKFVRDGRTFTQLNALQDVARIEEMARMLGGANDESMHHAAQMLDRGLRCHAS